MIDRSKIEKNLTTIKLGKNLELFKEIDKSTNDYLFEKIKAGVPSGSTVIAEIQHGGRGRVGRNWQSGEEGESIALSFFVNAKVEPTKLSSLTLVVALCVRNAIIKVTENEKACLEQIKIKWPNDLLINGKKVCGILCELRNIENKNAVVVGIGINLSQTLFREEIQNTATSLALEKINITSIEKLIAEILNEFEGSYMLFEKEGFAPFAKEYNSVLAGVGTSASVNDANGRSILEGKIICTNESGELIIEDENGCINTVNSGEVSIRGGFYGK